MRKQLYFSYADDSQDASVIAKLEVFYKEEFLFVEGEIGELYNGRALF